MPAIPVMARIEAHLSDAQLVAFNGLMERLIVAHYENASTWFLDAAQGEKDLATDMLNAVCLVHVAARHAMLERNMPEAA
ncbi:hypothetical protein CAL26_05845 [Bordetella genomosp. 9]|uniref:Uncharacterized protein n=1 Tax=Bordetella genomosp. 9 TaxID=1416803 RepID=A0A261RP52_9BORD|nr:hypothetical protein [Bordetella genomosp. 9]OZI26834.1 hypothetical protein CAL26_05845 [Bordetella genomosp. 9]